MYNVNQLKRGRTQVKSTVLRNILIAFTKPANFWLSVTNVNDVSNLVYFTYKSKEHKLTWTYDHLSEEPLPAKVNIVNLVNNQTYEVDFDEFGWYLYRRLIADAKRSKPGTKWRDGQAAIHGWNTIIDTANRAWEMQTQNG